MKPNTNTQPTTLEEHPNPITLLKEQKKQNQPKTKRKNTITKQAKVRRMQERPMVRKKLRTIDLSFISMFLQLVNYE